MLSENEDSSVYLDAEVRYSSLFPGPFVGHSAIVLCGQEQNHTLLKAFFVCFLSWPHLHNHCSP